MAGVDLVSVQYRGSGPALTDLIGGLGCSINEKDKTRSDACSDIGPAR
jgi:hypothetical protein